MNWHDVWNVFCKDALQTLRDRNTLIIMILGILTLPIGTSLTAALVQHRVEAGATKQARLIVHGVDAPWVAQEIPKHKDLTLTVAPSNVGIKSLLQSATTSGALILDLPNNFRRDIERPVKRAPAAKLYMDNRRDNLNERIIVEEALENWRDKLSRGRLAEKSSVPMTDSYDTRVEIRSLASNADRTGAFLGLLLPVEITLSILLLSLYSATDLITAERERKTLVLLAVAPPNLRDVLVGKMFVVLSTVTLGTLLTIVTQIGLFALLVRRGVDMAGSFPVTIPFPAVLGVLPMVAPLIIFLSSISIVVGAFARNFQQAQSYASLLLILFLLPAGATMISTADFPPVVAIIPIVSTALAVRDLLGGQLNWQFATTVLLSSCTYAVIALLVATKLLDSEHSVFPQDEPMGSWRATLRLLATFIGGVFIAFFVVGQTFQSISALYGVLLSQVLIIGMPAVFFVKWLRLPFAETLSFRPPTSLLTIPGAVLLAPLTVLLACCIMAVQDFVLPAPKELNEMLLRTLVPPGMPMWLVFATVALAPAVCEEIMFRGLMQGVLLRSVAPRVVLPLVAFAFGLFHMSAFRLLPTATLGLLLCYLTYRYRSIFPAMTLHLCHNAIGVVIAIHHVDPFTWQNLVIAMLSGTVAAALLLAARRQGA